MADRNSIRELQGWIVDHLDQPLTVEELAELANMSPRNIAASLFAKWARLRGNMSNGSAWMPPKAVSKRRPAPSTRWPHKPDSELKIHEEIVSASSPNDPGGLPTPASNRRDPVIARERINL
jgi:hypothetical protein